MQRWLRPSLILMVALLGGCELVVRTFCARNMSGRFEYGYNPTSGFEEDGKGDVRLVRAGGRRFRPQAFRMLRPEKVFRVMVIGDSVARGPSLEDAYPWLIGEQLRAGGIQAESLNLGVPGFGALRKLIVLRKAIEYQPSLIILHVNNSNEYEDEREFKRSEEFKGWHPKNWLMKSLVIRRLYEAKTENIFWGWLPPEIRLQRAVNDADAKLVASMSPAKLREWNERVEQFTRESVRLAQGRHIPILIVHQAWLDRDASGKAQLDDHGLDQLLSSLNGSDVYHLSMRQLFQSMRFEPLFSDSAHLLRAGHELVATAIVQQLLATGLVSR